MALSETLHRLFAAIVAEAETNPAFGAKLEAALFDAITRGSTSRPLDAPAATQPSSAQAGCPPAAKASKSAARRPAARRAPAALNPVELAERGEAHLRRALGVLSEAQLRDIVAEFGLATGQKFSGWKAARLVKQIVEGAMLRAHKGDAFLA